MFLKRIIPAVGVALALGVAACGGDEDKSSDSKSTQNKAVESTGSTAPVKIAVSVPAADHGWLKAVADDAKKAGEDLEGVSSRSTTAPRTPPTRPTRSRR